MALIAITFDDEMEQLVQQLMELTDHQYSLDELVEKGLKLLIDQDNEEAVS